MKKHLMISILFLFFTLVVGPFSQAQDCSAVTVSGATARYCVTRLQGFQTSRILYYFHGNGGSEGSWLAPDVAANHEALEDLWARQQQAPPLIITISWGPTWFLTLENGLLKATLSQVIPQIEQALRLRPQSRVLMGDSMGGFNSMQVYFQQPQLFNKFVINCPAVLSFSPWAPESEVEAYVARHRPYVIPKLVTKWRDKMRDTFRSEQSWKRHNPLLLAMTSPLPNAKLFLSSDGVDPFGFQEATVRVKDQLVSRKASIVWQWIPQGGHCVQTTESLKAMAQFVVSP